MPNVVDQAARQISKAATIEMLNDFITSLAGGAELELWLYQTNIAPSPGNTLATFAAAEATFSGYSRQTGLTAGDVGYDASGNAFTTYGLQQFACSGAGVSNTIYGSLFVATNQSGTQATATNAGNAGAYLSSSVITDAGSGYLVPPIVTITGATGSDAAAYATIADGEVTGIVFTNLGSGYTTYTMTIEKPLYLVKQNVLSASGISMALSTDLITTYTQLIQPSVAA